MMFSLLLDFESLDPSTGDLHQLRTSPANGVCKNHIGVGIPAENWGEAVFNVVEGPPSIEFFLNCIRKLLSASDSELVFPVVVGENYHISILPPEGRHRKRLHITPAGPIDLLQTVARGQKVNMLPADYRSHRLYRMHRMFYRSDYDGVSQEDADAELQAIKASQVSGEYFSIKQLDTQMAPEINV